MPITVSIWKSTIDNWPELDKKGKMVDQLVRMDRYKVSFELFMYISVQFSDKTHYIFTKSKTKYLIINHA